MDITRRPVWLKKKIEFEESRSTRSLLNSIGLNTVCKEAKCPNISECFKRRHATFLILGKYCTRHCSFCNVEKSTLRPRSGLMVSEVEPSNPQTPDSGEPKKVALAVKKLRLKHVIITSVTRDDLPDGGASLFIETVSEIRKWPGSPHIELLIPDFKGDAKTIKTITGSKPDIIGHNLETVPRLYGFRPEANYKTSLRVLKLIKETDKNIYTKSALMLGLGEKEGEVMETMEDLRKAECDFLALGQYLRPSEKNVEVQEYVPPEKFDAYKSRALSLGFKHVESGPFVRSSYLASEYLRY